MSQFSNEPLDFGDLFSTSFTSYRKAFKQLLIWGILIAICKVIEQFFIPLDTIDSLKQVHTGTIIQLISTLACFAAVHIILVVGLIYQFFQILIESPKTFTQAFQVAIYRGSRAVLGSLIILILGIIVVGAIGWILFKINHWLAISSIVVIAIYLWIVLFAWIPLVAIENRSIYSSIKESFHLVKGEFGQTLGVLFFGVMVFLICSFILSSLFRGLFLLFPSLSAASLNIWTEIITGSLVNIFVLPWFFGLTILLIHNLRLAKEQRDAINKAIDDRK